MLRDYCKFFPSLPFLCCHWVPCAKVTSWVPHVDLPQLSLSAALPYLSMGSGSNCMLPPGISLLFSQRRADRHQFLFLLRTKLSCLTLSSVAAIIFLGKGLNFLPTKTEMEQRTLKQRVAIHRAWAPLEWQAALQDRILGPWSGALTDTPAFLLHICCCYNLSPCFPSIYFSGFFFSDVSQRWWSFSLYLLSWALFPRKNSVMPGSQEADLSLTFRTVCSTACYSFAHFHIPMGLMTPAGVIL